MPKFSYDRNLKDYSRINRKSQTDAERCLWHHLRGRTHGYKFRRQFPIENFILDFYCSEKKLAIELDGGQHKANRSYDNYRTNILAQLGIRVVRFWDNDILKNTNSILGKIIEELKR